MARVERRQVSDIAPAPPPYVTEYRIITRTCPCCTASWAGTAPEGVAARAQYGPRVLATAAELTCPLPAGRPRHGVVGDAGRGRGLGRIMAGVRGRAARLLGCSTLNWPHCSFAHRNPVARAVTASAVMNLGRCSKSASRSSATAAHRRPGPTTWNLLPDGPPLEDGGSATGG